RDIIPQSLPLLPPASYGSTSTPDPTSSLSAGGSLNSLAHPSPGQNYLRTPQNIFGLLRQYHSDKLPSHDPEEHIELQDLTDTPVIDRVLLLSQHGQLSNRN